jgi:hypothetical protein
MNKWIRVKERLPKELVISQESKNILNADEPLHLVDLILDDGSQTKGYLTMFFSLSFWWYEWRCKLDNGFQFQPYKGSELWRDI